MISFDGGQERIEWERGTSGVDEAKDAASDVLNALNQIVPRQDDDSLLDTQE